MKLDGDWELFSTSEGLSTASGSLVASADIVKSATGDDVVLLSMESSDGGGQSFYLPLLWPDGIELEREYVDRSPRRESVTYMFHQLRLDDEGAVQLLHLTFFYKYGRYNVGGEFVLRNDDADVVTPVARAQDR